MAYIKLLALRLLHPLAGIVPHKFLMVIAGMAGRILSYGNKATVMKRELRRMLGEQATEVVLKKVVLEALQNNMKDLFEIFSFPNASRKKLERYVYFDGREYIDEVLAKGKGAVIGVVHFGSWKIIIAALSYAGYPTHQIAIDPLTLCNDENASYANKVMELERLSENSLPARFIYVGRFMRELFRAFKDKALVLISLDGLQPKEPRTAKLLNMVVPVDQGAMALALRFDVPLIPIFAIREKDDRHRLVVHRPILVDKTLDPEVAKNKAFEKYLNIFRAHVAKHPSHYSQILYLLAKDRQEVLQ